jgi:hypothetical protein
MPLPWGECMPAAENSTACIPSAATDSLVEDEGFSHERGGAQKTRPSTRQDIRIQDRCVHFSRVARRIGARLTERGSWLRLSSASARSARTRWIGRLHHRLLKWLHAPLSRAFLPCRRRVSCLMDTLPASRKVPEIQSVAR